MFDEGEMNAAVVAYQQKRIAEGGKLAARYKIEAVAKLAGVSVQDAEKVIHTLREFERRRNEERHRAVYEAIEIERRSEEEIWRRVLEMRGQGSQEVRRRV